MAQNTEFAKSVKIELIRRDWTFDDLAAEVRKRTGMFCDSAYISKILSENRNPPKILASISEILGLEAKA